MTSKVSPPRPPPPPRGRTWAGSPVALCLQDPGDWKRPAGRAGPALSTVLGGGEGRGGRGERSCVGATLSPPTGRPPTSTQSGAAPWVPQSPAHPAPTGRPLGRPGPRPARLGRIVRAARPGDRPARRGRRDCPSRPRGGPAAAASREHRPPARSSVLGARAAAPSPGTAARQVPEGPAALFVSGPAPASAPWGGDRGARGPGSAGSGRGCGDTVGGRGEGSGRAGTSSGGIGGWGRGRGRRWGDGSGSGTGRSGAGAVAAPEWTSLSRTVRDGGAGSRAGTATGTRGTPSCPGRRLRGASVSLHVPCGGQGALPSPVAAGGRGGRHLWHVLPAPLTSGRRGEGLRAGSPRPALGLGGVVA